MKIYFLGTMGYHPVDGENTACYLIEYKNKLIMLDAGTGVSNLIKYKSILNKYDDIHIILSHYHQDHIAGLFYLNNFFSNMNINIYGPGEPFYLSAKDILFDYTNKDLSSTSINDMGRKMCIFEYNLNGFYIDDILIKTNLQNHTNHSFGINIDNKLHYATDTIASKETFKLSLSSDILLHECWSLDITNDKHSSLKEIITLNELLNIRKIFLIHKNPNWNDEDFKRIELLTKNSQIFLGKDGMELKID